MQAFSNENLKDNLCGGCDCTGFAPSVTFTYNAETGSLVVTDATTYPAGAARSVVKFSVHDKSGNKVIGSIASDDGDDAVTVSLSDLDGSEGIDILATVVSDDGCISDGHYSNIGAAGALGKWDKDNDAVIVGGSSSPS
jgi:hypothetical protein